MKSMFAHGCAPGRFALAAVSLLSMLAAPAIAAQTASHTPLRPQSECLRVDRINEWHVVDHRTAIVRTGPKRYLVKLQASCPRLGIGNPGLLFSPNESNKALGESRICGETGETVRARDQPPCAIASVRVIDKAQFDRLGAAARHHGSGADQPTRP